MKPTVTNGKGGKAVAARKLTAAGGGSQLTATEAITAKRATDETSQAPSNKKQKLLIGLVLGLCMAGAAALSYFVFMRASLRLDEAQSLWQTSHSLLGTLRVVAADVHVPLYHIVLHIWQTIFGQTIEAARTLSLLFFVATIPVIYLLARKVLSLNWALFATALFSFSPFMSWYGSEARMYTMLVLVASLSQLFFVKLIRSQGKRGWLGYSLTALIGIYSHYFFFFTLVAQALYYLTVRKHFVKRTFLKFVALAVALAAAFTPWLLYFRSQGSASNTSPNLQTPSSVDFFNVYSQFSFGFHNDVLNTVLVSPWPILVIAALLSVKTGQKITKPVGYLLAAGLLPVILAYIASYLVTPFFVSRYMIASLAPLLIVLVWFVSHYRRWLAVAIASLMIAVTALGSYQQFTSASTPLKEDFRAASNLISQRATASDVVVLSAPFSVYPFNYYYDGDARVNTIPAWDRTEPGPIPAFSSAELPGQVRGLATSHQYVYLLLSSDQGYQEEVYQYFEQRYENTFSRQFSPDLQLEVYRVGYSQLPKVEDL